MRALCDTQNMVGQPCTVCGSTDGTEVIRLPDGAYRQCSRCQMVFASPMPPDLAQRNEEGCTASLAFYAGKVDALRGRNRRKLRRFSRYRRTGRLLEIGCSAGAALDVARQMGWQVKGVDLCASSSAHARERLGLDVFTGTVEAAAFPDNYFDVVFSNAVLEHLGNPLSTLRECRRILRPGGVFYADTVNWDSYTRRLLGERWKYLSPRAHPHLYTPGSVLSLCRHAGLEHLRTWTTGVRFQPHSGGGFRARRHWGLLKGPLSLWARWTNKGDHVKFLARKPLE